MPDDPQLDALKLPPHSLEAEQSVLGGLLLDNDAVDKVGDVLAEADFYSEAHRLIYQHIVGLVAEAKPADVVTVSESLASVQKLDYVGGLAYLGALVGSVPTAANIRHYAQIVRDRSILRQLAATAGDIADAAYNPLGRSAKEVLDQAEAKVLHIAEQGSRGAQQYQEIGTLLAGVVERIETLYNRDDPSDVTGVPTGFSDLDRMTSGLQPGDLVVVAGRPSMGKTALALNIGEHVALAAGMPVAVFSMEMGASQLALRLIGSVGRLDQHKLRTGRLASEDWEKLTAALGRLNEAPILIDETPALNAIEVRSRARRLMKTYGKLGLVIVDYLQLMQASTTGENRATEISEISRAMKALAKELKVPVMALSQLNRSLEQRPNKRPVMSDLRESRRDRTGCRRDPVHLSRRGLQPGNAGKRRGRDHHRQAAQRADRHRAPDVPRRIYALRELRCRPGLTRAPPHRCKPPFRATHPVRAAVACATRIATARLRRPRRRSTS